MKYLMVFFSFLVFHSSSVLAQEEDIHKFGINASILTTKQFFENKRLGEAKLLYGFQTEFDYFLHISDKIKIKTGLSYSFIRINQLDYTPIFECDIDPILGINSRNSWFEDRYNIHYVGIPFEFHYSFFSPPNNQLYAKIGIEPLLNLSHNANKLLHECGINQKEINRTKEEELNNPIVMINFGIGYILMIDENRSFYIEPEIAYSFNNIFKDTIPINNSKILQRKLTFGFLF